MPKIVIEEWDRTTPGTSVDNMDVVFVPGLVNEDWADANPDKVLPVDTPTRFDSYSDFIKKCGPRPYAFKNNQTYGAAGTWATAAMPLEGSSAILFKGETSAGAEDGDYDPGYIMAAELLNRGLSVVYERINVDPVTFTALSTEPEDWNTQPSGFSNKYFRDTLGNQPVYFDTTNETITHLTPTPYESVGGSDVGISTAVSENTPSDPRDFVGPLYGSDNVNASTCEYAIYLSKYYSPSGIAPQDFTTGTNAYYSYDDTTGIYTLLNPNSSSDPQWPEDLTIAYILTSNPTVVSREEITETITVTTPQFVADTYYELTMPTEEQAKELPIAQIYNALSVIFTETGYLNNIADKGNYDIKYITSGGYPVYEYNDNQLAYAMTKLAYNRGDCVALIDHTDNEDRTLNIDETSSLFKSVENAGWNDDWDEYATMFTPWASYVRQTLDKKYNAETDKWINLNHTTYRAPASFAYLCELADSIKTNAPWLAIAGVNRGLVGGLVVDNGVADITNIPNGLADAMEPRDEGKRAINSITNINPYGYTIWGNRTLQANTSGGGLTATSFLNIRNMVSDIKKVCYRACRYSTFEQNNDILWVNLKSKITPTLNRMLSGYGLSGYDIVRDTAREAELGKAVCAFQIILYPVYPVEDFYISILLKDDEVTID